MRAVSEAAVIYGYSPDTSKNHKKQRALHADQLPRGNKSEQLATLRAKQKLQEKEAIAQTHLDFSFGDNDHTEEVNDQKQPFSEQHDWESSRYAGVFIYWIPLLFQSRWLQLIIGHFGTGWRIFSVFLLMTSLNIRSIEQTKHLRFLHRNSLCIRLQCIYYFQKNKQYLEFRLLLLRLLF